MLIGRRGYAPGSISIGLAASLRSPERKELSPKLEIFLYKLKGYPDPGQRFDKRHISGFWLIWWLEKHGVKTLVT